MRKILSVILVSTFSLTVAAKTPVSTVGLFTTPVGENHASPAFPGKSFEFEVKARSGEYLNFTSMYGVSNDWFFSSATGIKLRRGLWDVTNLIQVYDAGTEVDQNLEDAPDIGPNQTAPNTGLADRVNFVRSLSVVPSLEAKNFIKVTTQSLGNDTYKVKIAVLDNSKTPASPGVFWTTKTGYKPFIINHSQLNNGLEAQSEDGNPATLFESIKAHSAE